MTSEELQKAIWWRVRRERERQDAKWGEQSHEPYKWYAIIGEEFGEVSRAILEEDREAYHKELIEVIASCVAALESDWRQHT